jgi:hypothetical protein
MAVPTVRAGGAWRWELLSGRLDTAPRRRDAAVYSSPGRVHVAPATAGCAYLALAAAGCVYGGASCSRIAGRFDTLQRPLAPACRGAVSDGCPKGRSGCLGETASSEGTGKLRTIGSLWECLRAAPRRASGRWDRSAQPGAAGRVNQSQASIFVAGNPPPPAPARPPSFQPVRSLTDRADRLEDLGRRVGWGRDYL